jgi:ElaB/YqjD/DUF883 family membrane-anchored ribosome-binding protein
MNQTSQVRKETQPDGPTRDAPVTDRAAERAHETIDSAAARAATVERRIRDEAAGARETLQERKTAAAAQVDDSLARVESFIRERPMTAAGIAFAAGVLVSRLLRRARG